MTPKTFAPEVGMVITSEHTPWLFCPG